MNATIDAAANLTRYLVRSSIVRISEQKLHTLCELFDRRRLNIKNLLIRSIKMLVPVKRQAKFEHVVPCIYKL